MLSKHGVETDSMIVLYDNRTSRLSTRMFWTLRYYGHQDIRILDGGEQAWVSAGNPLVEEVPQYAASNYRVSEINSELLANRDYIAQGLATNGIVLVDGRPAVQYSGDAPGKVFHTGVAYVALMDAVGALERSRGSANRSPIHGQVAAVSVGIYQGQPVLDLDYAEDSEAETDLNVVMNDNGAFIEIQGTAEGHAFRRDELDAMLTLAGGGVATLLELQRDALEG